MYPFKAKEIITNLPGLRLLLVLLMGTIMVLPAHKFPWQGCSSAVKVRQVVGGSYYFILLSSREHNLTAEAGLPPPTPRLMLTGPHGERPLGLVSL